MFYASFCLLCKTVYIIIAAGVKRVLKLTTTNVNNDTELLKHVYSNIFGGDVNTVLEA